MIGGNSFHDLVSLYTHQGGAALFRKCRIEVLDVNDDGEPTRFRVLSDNDQPLRESDGGPKIRTAYLLNSLWQNTI